MTSLAVSGQLENVIKYSTKVHKAGPVGQESNNTANVYPRITKSCADIYGDHSTEIQDMTSLAASSGLKNATKYYTKVCKMGAASIEVRNSVTV